MKILLCICLLFALTQAKSFRGDKVFRITINNQQQYDSLEKLVEDYELDYWRRLKTFGDAVDIRVPFFHLDQFLVFLTTSELTYHVFIEDVQQLIDQHVVSHPAPKDLASFNYEEYHNFEEIQQWIDDLSAAYPSFVSKSVVGTSHEGRTFSAITVGSGSNSPQFVIDCGIHSREWITPATCLFAAKFLVDGYNENDATIKSLIANVDFVIIPCSNPDGYAYSWSNDRMWRKTRTRNGVCVGVDPNRNWDSNHCGTGSSTSACSESFCGPAPFSEPCVLAQKNFVEGLPNVQMYVDMHSYGQMWMYPYGYTNNLTPDDSVMRKIASDSVTAIRSKHGKIYEAGSIANVIYVASGTTADYFYDKAGIRCAFATELRDTGRYGFLIPENQILPTAEESFEAFKVMAQAVAEGKCPRK